jgi:hypothetical protein
MLPEMMQKILIVMIIFPNDSDDKRICGQYDHYWCFEFDYGDKVVARFSNIGKVNVDVLHRV